MGHNYLESIGEHIAVNLQQLDKLAAILDERELTDIELKATERYLQTSIGTAIGIAKQCLVNQSEIVKTSAYDSFVELEKLGFIESGNIDKWKSIIGLRNTLVHDYLNVDVKVINSVLKNRMYYEIRDFYEYVYRNWR